MTENETYKTNTYILRLDSRNNFITDSQDEVEKYIIYKYGRDPDKKYFFTFESGLDTSGEMSKVTLISNHRYSPTVYDRVERVFDLLVTESDIPFEKDEGVEDYLMVDSVV